jgi:hypothetical protein
MLTRAVDAVGICRFKKIRSAHRCLLQPVYTGADQSSDNLAAVLADCCWCCGHRHAWQQHRASQVFVQPGMPDFGLVWSAMPVIAMHPAPKGALGLSCSHQGSQSCQLSAAVTSHVHAICATPSVAVTLLSAASMQSQVLALDVILANGTRQVFTNETHPFLMRVSSMSGNMTAGPFESMSNQVATGTWPWLLTSFAKVISSNLDSLTASSFSTGHVSGRTLAPDM